MENYMLPFAQVTGRIAYVPPFLCGDVYAPSEWHVCYTLRRGCSYAEAAYKEPGDVYAFLRPSATFLLSAIPIYRMPHSPPICLILRCCQLLHYSLHFGYIACRCICFAIIIFYRSGIYCPTFTLCSTMPSVLHILRWSIISLRCFVLLIRIRIVAILVLIPFDITGSQVNEKWPGKGKKTKDGKGKGTATEDWEGKGKGKGKAMEEGKGKGNGNGRGKGIINQTPGVDDTSCAIALQLQKEMYEAD